MNGKAQNSPETGFHALPTEKWNPNFCQARDDRSTNSTRIRPTTPSTVRAARNMRPRKPESRLKNDLFQAEEFRAGLTREILGDSDAPINFVGRAPNVCSA